MNKLLQFAFRDLFALLFAMFFLFALVPHKKHEDEKSTRQINAQGEIIFDISWPYDRDVDVDLWVKHGGAEKEIGYSNKGDINCNILRDDLGSHPALDTLPVNYERVVCRKFEDGEWIANVHFYGGNAKAALDVPVNVVVTQMKDGLPQTLYTGKVVLESCSVQHTALSIIKTPSEGVKVIKGEARRFALSHNCGGH